MGTFACLFGGIPDKTLKNTSENSLTMGRFDSFVINILLGIIHSYQTRSRG
jgi:hypothetical protein